MLTAAERRAAAEALLGAIESHVALVPLSVAAPHADLTDAYEISRLVNHELVAAGDTLCGHKIGLTSRPMQEFAGIDEPDYGHLRTSMFVADGGTISARQLFRPLVEAELAFVLATNLRGPDVSAEEVIAATELILPCLEIVDMRFEPGGGLVDTIADNASSGLVVLGERGAPIDDVDLRQLSVVVRDFGREVARGRADEVMGNPVHAVAWLANKLYEFGTELERGQIILSGSFVSPVPITTGAVISATFDQLGTVKFALADGQ